MGTSWEEGKLGGPDLVVVVVQMRWRLRLRERGGCRARAAGPMGGLGLERGRHKGTWVRCWTIVDRTVLELQPIASGGAGARQSCSCLPPCARLAPRPPPLLPSSGPPSRQSCCRERCTIASSSC